jgi:hypothetical protein
MKLRLSGGIRTLPAGLRLRLSGGIRTLPAGLRLRSGLSRRRLRLLRLTRS